MKGWRAACWTLVLLGIPAAGRAEFDQCRLIDQVLNRLGNAMAVNRLIIARSSDSSAVAAPVAARYGPHSSASSRKAAVLTDQPPGHGSVGTKPAASAVLADGDGQGLSISVSPACLEFVRQPVSPFASRRSRPWSVGVW